VHAGGPGNPRGRKIGRCMIGEGEQELTICAHDVDVGVAGLVIGEVEVPAVWG
jgi:hypothetical protein